MEFMKRNERDFIGKREEIGITRRRGNLGQEREWSKWWPELEC